MVGVTSCVVSHSSNTASSERRIFSALTASPSRELVFLYQERKSDGELSNFFQLDNPRS